MNIHFIIVIGEYSLARDFDVVKYVAAQTVVKSTIRSPNSEPLPPAAPAAVFISQIAPSAPVSIPASLRIVILSFSQNAEMNNAENGVAVRITDASMGEVFSSA